MAATFVKRARRNPRPQAGATKGKELAATEAGLRLLVRKDYEAISMMEISREAGCSLGTLYARYSDKEEYLYRVIASAFRDMESRANLPLAKEGWARASPKAIAQQIVGHVIQEMTSPRGAGVIRAAMKLSTTKPLVQEPFEKYRTKITELSADLLADKTRQPRSAVRIGMQVVLGTITDAILQKRPGPMNAGSGRMTGALANILSGYLGLEEGESWAGDEADAEDGPSDIHDFGSQTPPELEDGEIAIFDPDMRTYVGKRTGLRQKQRKRRKGVTANDADAPVAISERKPVVSPSKSVAAKSAATSDREKQPSKSARKRHRVV